MPRNKLRSAKEDALNKVEAGMLLEDCADLLDSLVVRLLLYAGMRIGEVQHLKKSWLDWDKGIIVVKPDAKPETLAGRTRRTGSRT